MEANTPTWKSIKPINNTTEKILKSTFISQIVICLIIVLGFLISIFHPYSNEPTSSIESTTLSLIGMAISVWIGLNIYNTISKEDLHTLKDSLLHLESELQLQLNKTQEEVKKATEQMYTEILKSKFRMSSTNTASKYFAIQLDSIGPFQTEIYETILELEDLFQISYRLYGEHISSQDNPAGACLAEKLAKKASELNDNGTLNSEQYRFLMGYANWRWGDFMYYQARHNTSIDKSVRINFAEFAIDRYKKVMDFLFSIQNIKDFDQHAFSDPESKDSLCYLANDIASAYIDIIKDLSYEELNEAISAEKFATKHSGGIPDRVREKFSGILGVLMKQITMRKTPYNSTKRPIKLILATIYAPIALVLYSGNRL